MTRKEAIKILSTRDNQGMPITWQNGFVEAYDMAIEALSIEVVRCKDCMFNHWHETPNREKYHICNLNQLAFSEHDDFYCAYGERKEDDN